MAKLDFNVFQGRKFSKTLVFTDSNGNAIDISGWTFYFTVKTLESAKYDNDDSSAKKKIVISISDGTSGRVTFTWDSVDIDTGNYVYDVVVMKGTDGPYTYLHGDFVVNVSVTKEVG